MNKPLIIFDLDGTLVDCKELHQRAFRSAVGDLMYADEEVEGLPTSKKIEYLQSQGMRVPADAWEQKQRLTFEVMEDFIQYNDPLWEQIWRLKDRYDFAVCSNATRRFTETVLDILEIKTFMNCGIYTADEHKPKPSPEMYWRAMENHAANRVWIYEDSPVGLQAARASGANVIAVENSRQTIKKLSNA